MNKHVHYQRSENSGSLSFSEIIDEFNFLVFSNNRSCQCWLPLCLDVSVQDKSDNLVA